MHAPRHGIGGTAQELLGAGAAALLRLAGSVLIKLATINNPIEVIDEAAIHPERAAGCKNN